MCRLWELGTIRGPTAQSHYKHPSVYSLSWGSYYQACGTLSSLSTPEMSLFFSRLKPSLSHILRTHVADHHFSSVATQSHTGVWNGCRCYQFCQSWQPLQLMQHRWCAGPCPRLSLQKKSDRVLSPVRRHFQLVKNSAMFQPTLSGLYSCSAKQHSKL